MDSTHIILIVWVIALIGILGFLLKKLRGGPSDKDIKKLKNRTTDKNNLLWLYLFYKNTPFLDKYLAKTKNKVRMLYPADNFSIVKKTSQILAKGSLAGIIGIFLTIVLGRTDIWFLMLGLLITYLLVTGIVNKSLEKLEDVILEQFADFLGTIRHKYHETNIPTTSLSLSLDELPYEISLHIQNIYDIINSPDREYKIDQYVDIAPNQYVLMFLSIFASVTEYGDKILDDGTSLLLTDINYLKEEVNNERLRRSKNKYAFIGLKQLALAPILAIKPLAAWAVGNMSELSSYYTGIYGTVSMVVIFVVAFLTYTLIVALRDKEKEVEKDSNVFSKLAIREPIAFLLNKEIKKKYRKYEEYDNDMQALGDHSGPKAFLLKRIVYGVALFSITIILLFYTNITQKFQYINDWNKAFEDSVAVDPGYLGTLQQAGKEFSHEYAHSTADEINKDGMVTEILSKSEIGSETYAEIVAAEVIERVRGYQNTYFRWWYLLIAIGLAVTGYMAPVIILHFKRRIIDTRKEEEVVQFQSLILILMHMDGTTVATILEWMERFSYCFKEDIAECRVNLSHGERDALIMLRDSQRYVPFRDFIENMLSIDRVGVVDAFDEIKVDRSYYKDNRKEMTEQSIRNKSSLAKLLAFIPMGITILLYLIIPVLLFAFSMLDAFNASFS